MDPGLNPEIKKTTETRTFTKPCGYRSEEAPPNILVQSTRCVREVKQRTKTRLDDMLPYKARERTREISCKRPSELRSKRTPKGSVLRLDDLDDRTLEEDLVDEVAPSVDSSVPTETKGNDGRADNVNVDTNLSREVSIESLIVHKRKGKMKALMDEYDFLPKPGSKAIITLEDEDQEFVDGWAPDFYIEPVYEIRYPLYSDVVRTGSLTPEHPGAS
ncbi:hypothetical protein FRB91_009437 [Serendipita sp. 411]|nr:hypothetical protein FRC18_005929 [Serendipita sp. 400]KAG8858655.1 hypothetical protein FRB91_009437 [Serendipita sp. 411]